MVYCNTSKDDLGRTYIYDNQWRSHRVIITFALDRSVKLLCLFLCPGFQDRFLFLCPRNTICSISWIVVANKEPQHCTILNWRWWNYVKINDYSAEGVPHARYCVIYPMYLVSSIIIIIMYPIAVCRCFTLHGLLVWPHLCAAFIKLCSNKVEESPCKKEKW